MTQLYSLCLLSLVLVPCNAANRDIVDIPYRHPTQPAQTLPPSTNAYFLTRASSQFRTQPPSTSSAFQRYQASLTKETQHSNSRTEPAQLRSREFDETNANHRSSSSRPNRFASDPDIVDIPLLRKSDDIGAAQKTAKYSPQDDDRFKRTTVGLQRSPELGEVRQTAAGPKTTRDPLEVVLEDVEREVHAKHGSRSTTRKASVSDEVEIPWNDPDVVHIGPAEDVRPQNTQKPWNDRSSNVGDAIGPLPVDDSRPRVGECYSGFSLVNGETVATGKEECPNDDDYCYNATLTGPMIGKLGKAGCASMRCKLAGAVNRCVDFSYIGYQLHFCCCDGFSLCNSKFTHMNIVEQGFERIKDSAKIFDRILDMVG